jgi:proline racemase
MTMNRVIQTVDAHCEGEASRVVVGGIIDVPGESMWDKKRYFETRGDDLRRFLLFEPRGQSCLSAVVVLPSRDPRAALGYVIMEGTDYPPMSGTNTINTVTVLLETGILPMSEPETQLTLETPAGLVEVRARCSAGKCESVTFRNVPCFATHLAVPVEVEGVGTVDVDIAYGGHFFGVSDAACHGFAITPDEAEDLATLGERVKAAVGEQVTLAHPENPGIHDLGLFVWTAPPRAGGDGRNATVVSPGRIDRSPCGTGTSARLAVMAARGELQRNQDWVHEGILDTQFVARWVDEVRIGEYTAVIPEITGRSWIYAHSSIIADGSDPLPTGYTASDTWGAGVPRPFDPETDAERTLFDHKQIPVAAA